MILGDDAPLGNWAWTWYDRDNVALSSGIFIVGEPPLDNGDSEDNVTDGEISELRQEVQDLEELVDQLSSDLQSALLLIEGLSSSTADFIDDFESDLEEVAEDVVGSMQDVDEVKGLASEAKISADDAKDAAEEAKSIAGQAKDDVDEAREDARKALNSSNVMKILVFIAILSSVGAIVMTLFGPFQISRKTV
jgi:chromosome segregation ATPase